MRYIRLAARSITLARLDYRICDEPARLGVTWHYFWTPPKMDSYFGAYREGAGFGEVREITENGLRCEITVAKYRKFATRLHLEAVFADVRALYWFSSRHKRR